MNNWTESETLHAKLQYMNKDGENGGSANEDYAS